MTQRAVGRIEVWDVTPALRYTINDAVGIYYKEIITEGVGNFNFAVYSHKDFSGTYTYPNIALGDKVKIWLDYDTIAGDPNFIGKITKRMGPHLMPTGWVRRIAGLSQGEILLRRLKKNKYYDGLTPASMIVEEWADDLGLGKAEIQADSTSVVLEIITKSYFDLLRWISDYWASADDQIKKDFLVNTNGNLAWKNRPFRTTGVESFTTADFLEDPLVERELETVKNNIMVYGSADKPLPVDKDAWTDSLTNWTATYGTLQLSTNKKLGTYSIGCQGPGGPSPDYPMLFQRSIDRVTIRNVNTVNFWHQFLVQPSIAYFRLLAPDTSNYFQADLAWGLGWHRTSLALGPDQIKDAGINPNGIWTKVGSPNWWNIQGIQFYRNGADTEDDWTLVDAFYFFAERWEGGVGDVTSKNLYGQRDLEVTDDKLHSDSECTKRAVTLLYQLKNPPIQVTITVDGNDNVLVGDRLTLTIPSEGISAQPYDVIAVENQLSLERWTTTFTAVNSAEWRLPLQMRQQIEMRRRLRELSIDEKIIH